MAYLVVEDFRQGLDVRKMQATLPAGTLFQLNNAHINRGGEIEKRLAFELATDTLAGTLGLWCIDGMPVVFGEGTRPGGLDAMVDYQQLTPPVGRTINQILDVDLFANKLYVVVEFDDFSVDHYYDGTRVGAGWTFAANPGLTATTFRQKVYTVRDTLMSFCKLADPSLWGAGNTGSGYIDVGMELGQAFKLRASSVYQDRIACFATDATLIFAVDPDPDKNVLVQAMGHIGCLAPASAVPYADKDVFFLSETGIRSLRARDSSNTASVTDVGTPIDQLIVDAILAYGYDQAYYAQGTIEPTSGRYWLAIEDIVYVFSFFPSSKISAWSTYTPGFVIDNLASSDQTVWIRSGNNLYRYGGEDGATYDDSPVTVTLPYLDANMPATMKRWPAVDIASEGSWTIAMGTDPNNPGFYENVGILTGTTFGLPNHDMAQRAAQCSVKLTHEAAGPARLGRLVLHYHADEAR